MSFDLSITDANSVENIKKLMEQREITHIKLGLFDMDGIMRGKYVSKEKFFLALEGGLGFCDVILGWDSNDQLYENPGVAYTGWHSGYPDAKVRLVPDSCREIPFEPQTLLFLAEFDGDGENADNSSDESSTGGVGGAQKLCPRNLLRRICDQANSMGFDVKAAFEYEFFLFNETPDSIRDKGYQNLRPFTPGNFGYSMLRNSVHSDLYQDLLSLCQQMDFPLEGLHTETGPGVWEAAIAVDEAMAAADKAALFKTYAKVWAQRNHLMGYLYGKMVK